MLTPGQAGELPGCRTAAQLLRLDTIVLADKAYDADWLRRRIEAAGASPTSPLSVIAAGSVASAWCSTARATASNGSLAGSNHFRRLGHALPKARRQLPGHAQARCHPPMAAP